MLSKLLQAFCQEAIMKRCTQLNLLLKGGSFVAMIELDSHRSRRLAGCFRLHALNWSQDLEESRKWGEEKVTGRNTLYLYTLPPPQPVLSASFCVKGMLLPESTNVRTGWLRQRKRKPKKTARHCPDLAATQGSVIMEASLRQNVLYCTKQVNRLVLNVRWFSSPHSCSESFWPSLSACRYLQKPIWICKVFSLDSVVLQLADSWCFKCGSTTIA